MRNSYTIPEPYANENDRLRAYKAVLKRETPIAVVLIQGKHFWRYFAETSIGTIFFQIPSSECEDQFSQFAFSQKLLNFIFI